MELLFLSKISNHPFSLYFAQTLEVEEKMFWGQMRKYRKLHLNPTAPSIILPGQNFSTQLLTASSDIKTKNERIIDKKKQYKVKYIVARNRKMQIDIAFDTYHSQIFISIHKSMKQEVKVAETIVSGSLLKGKSSPLREKLAKDEEVLFFFQGLSQSKTLHVGWEQKYLKSDSQILNPIKLNSTLIIKKQQISLSEKVKLFRHIFLTELIAHMITNRFGRQKEKLQKYREGNLQWEYQDEELEELRSFGLRFYQFRDHPFQQKKLYNHHSKKKMDKKNQQIEENQDDYEDDDEDDQDYGYVGIPQFDSSDEQETNQKKEGNEIIKEEMKKTKLGKIKEKIQRVEGICNFTFISGKDKSNINRIRYCLHQMTQETDKTQALIDFVRLVFTLYPKEDLVTKSREIKKKDKMAYFLKQFRTKLHIRSCLEEYTRESFFHKVLNIGLRVLKQPFELAYLT